MAALALALIGVISLPSIARAEDARDADSPSIATRGALMFGLTYGVSVGATSAAYRNFGGEVATRMFVPVIGSWMMLADDKFNHDTTITRRLADATDKSAIVLPVAIYEYALLLLGPIAQGSGIVMMLIGASKDAKPSRAPSPAADRRPRPKVDVKPTFAGAGPGVSLSITEW